VDAPSDIRRLWFPPAGDVDPQHARRRRIAAHVRSVIAALPALDVQAVDEAELAEIEELAGRLAQRVAAPPDLRRRGPLPTLPAPDGALVERSPVSGGANPVAPPVHYSFEGEVTRAWTVFSPAYEGPPGGVHGGYVAAVFDEVLGVAQMSAGAAGFTGTLTVRYHRLTPVGERIDYEAAPVEQDGRKLHVHARATADGTLVAEAEGLFITQVTLDG